MKCSIRRWANTINKTAAAGSIGAVNRMNRSASTANRLKNPVAVPVARVISLDTIFNPAGVLRTNIPAQR
jgi:hypothetical protein